MDESIPAPYTDTGEETIRLPSKRGRKPGGKNKPQEPISNEAAHKEAEKLINRVFKATLRQWRSCGIDHNDDMYTQKRDALQLQLLWINGDDKKLREAVTWADGVKTDLEYEMERRRKLSEASN